MNGRQIVVLERGFVYVGNVSVAENVMTIANAQNVRRWGTTRGLGELAAKGPQADTKLDPAGTVSAPMAAVIHTIACDDAIWAPVLEGAPAAATA